MLHTYYIIIYGGGTYRRYSAESMQSSYIMIKEMHLHFRQIFN